MHTEIRSEFRACKSGSFLFLREHMFAIFSCFFMKERRIIMELFKEIIGTILIGTVTFILGIMFVMAV